MTNTTQTPAWLKPIEVAQHLNVALSTVTNWIARGDLPAFKHGQVVRISAQELNQFITSHPWRD